MKNKDIIRLHNGLQQVKDLPGVSFAYAVAKNTRIIANDIESLQKALEPSKEFSEYEEKRLDLAKKYAKKDEKGEPLTENNMFVMENFAEFNEQFKALQDLNKDVLDARKKQEEEYLELVEKDVSLELYKIDREDVPKDITGKQFEAIFDIIKD